MTPRSTEPFLQDPHPLTTTLVVRDPDSVLVDPESTGLVTPTEERYELRGPLGEGGMGEVLRVFDRSIRREVALKLLRADRASREFVNRFIEEGQVTGQLEHPNIAPIHEIGFDLSGQVYFTMKLVEGQSLRELVAASRKALEQGRAGDVLPLARRLEILRKICDAIGFAHSRGVIHRDLKPANVMLGAHGEVLVMDWGLAKIVGEPDRALPPVESDRSEAGADPTLVGVATGTPGYMPPEQVRGETVDRRTDVWALGALLYELLTFTKPYHRGCTRQTLVATLQDPVEPPAARVARLYGRHAPPLPPELVSIAARALAREPGERYQSVAELRADLEAFEEDRTVSVHVDRPVARLVKWTRRHPAGALGGGLAAIFLALLVAAGAFHRASVETLARQRAEAEQEALATEVARAEEARARQRAEVERDRAEAAFEGQVEVKGRLDALVFGRERGPIDRAFELDWREALDAGRTSLEFVSALDATRLDEAVACFEGLAGQEATVEDRFFLGLLRHRQGAVEEALSAYRAVTESDPSFWPGWIELGLLLLERGEVAAGREALRTGCDRGPPGWSERLAGRLEGQ